jgi:hypothetical protein
MKRTTKYVALDVHQATTVASVREESGRVIARSVLPTDEAAVMEFFRGMRGSIHVALEEGTQAQWLHDLLASRVDRVVVCDRRGAPRHGNKGDQVDADQLSELLRRGGLRAVYHGSAHRATLKELTRAYRTLVEDATRVMLRLKALFRARGIPTAGTAVYDPRHRPRWLTRLADAGARFRAEALYAELDVLRKLRPRAGRQFLLYLPAAIAGSIARTSPAVASKHHYGLTDPPPLRAGRRLVSETVPDASWAQRRASQSRVWPPRGEPVRRLGLPGVATARASDDSGSGL